MTSSTPIILTCSVPSASIYKHTMIYVIHITKIHYKLKTLLESTMARKRKQAIDQENISEVNMAWDGMASEEILTAALGGPRKARKKFVGVRQRPSGRWVAEIKDTIQKIRVWLGTFDTAVEAARAYDEAACLLRGANTRTNFWPSSQPFSTTSALPSRVASLLLRRLEDRDNSKATLAVSHNSSMPPVKRDDDVKKPDEVEFSDAYFSNFLSDVGGGTSDVYCNTSFESCMAVNVVDCCDDYIVDSCSSGDTNGGGEMEEEEEEVDFKFIDELGSVCNFSPFEMAQEIALDNGQEEEEPLTISEAMKRMKYERRFSASLYAFHGIPECLKRKLGAGEGVKARERSKMQLTDRQANEEGKKGVVVEREATDMGSVSSLNDGIDGELSLWSSLDLPTFCYVN